MTPRAWRILVIEGDAEIRGMVEDLLFDEGFEVCKAKDADSALLELIENSFDVLLCNLSLLRLEDGRLSRHVHKLKPTPRVVAMSASGAQARSDEANGNLPKPFTRAQLLEAIRPR